MRAPPESLIPITGQPYFTAMSMTLQIFSAKTSRERAAEDGEVLREDEDLATEDRPVAGDDGVAPRAVVAHPELDLAMADEAVELDERAGVEELLEPLAREQLAALALALDVPLARRVRRLLAQLLEPAELRLGRVVDLRHRAEPNAAPGAR